MASIEHVVLTRFNLPSIGPESIVRASPNWLQKRVELFERYCLPSMKNQTVHDKTWLIYFDPASPTWLRDWIAKAQETMPFHAIFRTSVSPEQLTFDIREHTPGTSDLLITTNLDNDDALSRDFLSRIGHAVTSEERTAFYLKIGLVRNDQELYLRSYRHNPFVSVAEPWSDPVTAWADWHTRMGRHMTVRVIPGKPAWLQVVHGTNVSNQVRGVLTDPERYLADFGGAISDLPSPPRSQLLLDTTLLGPIRAGKFGIRTGAKNVVLGTIGKERFDQLKYLIASARR